MRCQIITAAVMAAVFISSPSLTFAQAKVVESSPTIRPIGQSRSPQANAPVSEATANMQSDMYFQLQTLQQEVANLRGMLEEQNHELQRLKQQRLDDYVDLDRRVSELTQGGMSAPSTASRPTNAASSNTSTTNSSTTAPARSAVAGEDEFATYNGAMDLIRSKQYAEAIAGFNKYLTDFPQGQYAANSYHWLGQLHQLRNNQSEARDAYKMVVSNYSDHPKAQDAKLKLGQVLFQMGDKAQAKTVLQEVANSGSDEARLAKNFLQQNFP